MIRSLLPRVLILVACVVGTAEAARAQSAACQRYRAELAALERGGGRNYAALAERQRHELRRMLGYYRSLGCDRGQFLFFGAPPSPECGPAGQRIRAMEANLARLAQQAAAGQDYRRQQLHAAIAQTCQIEASLDARPRSLFESLFGSPEPRRYPDAEPRRYEIDEDDGAARPRRRGGRPVCVRTCDGYFFPLSNLPDGREGAEEMCQALCPATETKVYYMPRESNLDRAVSAHGTPYSELPNAFKYTKSFDPACSCRKPGQSWAAALRSAEAMIEHRRGDIVVTAEKAEELSRPKPAAATADPRATRGAKKAEKARVPMGDPAPADASADAVESEAVAASGAAAPTASHESSGIGPKSIGDAAVLGGTDGPRREIVTAEGSRRSVRIVAPNVIPVPRDRM